jgi:hypothetical protein
MDKKNINICVDVDLTASVLSGMLVIVTGIISLFTVRDAGFAGTCIVTGAGLVAAAKACNTIYDNAHKE